MIFKRKFNLKKLDSFTINDLTTHEKANVYGGQSTVVLINSGNDPDPITNSEGDPNELGDGWD